MPARIMAVFQQGWSVYMGFIFQPLRALLEFIWAKYEFTLAKHGDYRNRLD